jgi:AraC family transcriptional activator of mtrCDE
MIESPGGDLLSELMTVYDLKARVYATPRTCGLWHMELPASPLAEFHLVASGTCYLHLAPELAPPLLLHTGDIVLIPRGQAHALSANSDVPERGTRLFEAGPGAATNLVCGTFAIAGAHGNPLLASLEDIVVVSQAAIQEDIAALAVLLGGEARLEGRSARQTVLDRLAEVLFVYVLRHEIDRGAIHGGFLAALADSRLRSVLKAIHAEPGTHWTLARLARVANLSRTALAAHFHATVGIPPMQYLAEWRMHLAAQRLRGGTRSVAAVANELGYGSEAAFRRAYKRILGTGPVVTRRRARIEPA